MTTMPMRNQNDLTTRGKLPALLLVLALSALLAGCTSTAPADEYDPWEGMNRGLFDFNLGLDDWVLEPAASGWDWMIPDGGQRSVANFFSNWRWPVRFVGGLLQFELVDTAVDTGRFLVNTTVGLLGFFDVASDWGMEANHEDFGQTFGAWGSGPGTYLIVPFLGSYNVRDGFGAILDAFLDPVGSFLFPIRVVNWRAMNLDLIAENRATAFDFYAFVRNAYLQKRAALVEDRDPDEDDDDEDLYDLDA